MLARSRPGPDFPYHFSAFGGALAILAYPVSVSVSQAGLALALAGWGWWSLHRPRLLQKAVSDVALPPALPLVKQPVLFFALGIYAAQLRSLLINGLLSDDFMAFVQRGFNTELKDVFLVGMAFWTASFAGSDRGRRLVGRWLGAAVEILVVTGVVSNFSK